jgi:predicted anti-sigma-YlaC factor YlaD
MDCPDENTIARIQAGGADAQEQAQFHAHLDRCPECMRLMEALGHLDGALSPETRTSLSEPAASETGTEPSRRPWMSAFRGRVPAEWRATDLRVTVLAMALTHLSCAFILAPAGVRFFGQRLGTSAGIQEWRGFWVASAACVGLGLVVGPFLALFGWYGLVKNRRWAGEALRAYAATASATLLMIPMTACLLVVLRQESSRSGPKE